MIETLFLMINAQKDVQFTYNTSASPGLARHANWNLRCIRVQWRSVACAGNRTSVWSVILK